MSAEHEHELDRNVTDALAEAARRSTDLNHLVAHMRDEHNVEIAPNYIPLDQTITRTDFPDFFPNGEPMIVHSGWNPNPTADEIGNVATEDVFGPIFDREMPEAHPVPRAEREAWLKHRVGPPPGTYPGDEGTAE